MWKAIKGLSAEGGSQVSAVSSHPSRQCICICLRFVFVSALFFVRDGQMSHCRIKESLGLLQQQEWCSAPLAFHPVQPLSSPSFSPWSSSSSFSFQSLSLSSGSWAQKEMVLISWKLKETVEKLAGENRFQNLCFFSGWDILRTTPVYMRQSLQVQECQWVKRRVVTMGRKTWK